MNDNINYLSATKYGDFLNVDNRTIHRYMISMGYLDEELKITSQGFAKGLMYKFFKNETETIQYVAYPEGSINEDEIQRMQ